MRVTSQANSHQFRGHVYIVYLQTIYTLSTHYLKTIYKLSTQAHSHQIRGHVYIVDKNHLYIRKFSYDGGGSLDAYFWVKSTITIHSREYQSNTL